MKRFVVLIVLADQLGISVGDLFIGSLVPGVMLATMFALFVMGVAWFKPEAAPALPPSVATPTEAGALGAVGAIGLAAINRRLNKDALHGAMDETTRLTAMVMFLLIGSTAFALVFRGLYGDIWIEDLLTNLPGGKIGLLIVANLTIFILGFFIDFFEIAFIILPLLVPAARILGIDLVWFGVMIGMNLQTSFLTPPFGFSLFYLRGVTPEEIPTTAIYKGAIPFIIIQVIALALVIAFPELVTWPLK